MFRFDPDLKVDLHRDDIDFRIGLSLPAQADEEEANPVAGHQRKKRGRRPLDPALPREFVATSFQKTSACAPTTVMRS